MVKFFKYSTYFTLLLISSIFIALSGAYLYLQPRLPDVETLTDIKLQVPLRIYTSDGKLMGEFGEQRRTPIAFQDTPPLLIQAFISAEDGDFYQHHGISGKSLLRAISQMLTNSDVQTGGSTITMQVAKNYFLTPERNIIRKVREILLALQIEQQLSKQQIMELYINKIFLGHRAYGIVAAAQVYYGQPVEHLTLEQLATIAGIPKAPSAYNPIADPERALQRRNWILSRMLKLGYIDELDYNEALATPITASKHQVAIELNAPYVSEMARLEVLRLFGNEAYTAGLNVYTSIDSQLQKSAQQAVKNGLHAYDQRHGFRKPHHISSFNVNDPAPAFKQIADIPPLYASIATQVDDFKVEAILRNGETVTLDWPDLSHIKPYINANTFDRPIESAKKIIRKGDVLYLKQNTENEWEISQVPEAEAALVSLNPDNGAILALVGGYDFYKSKYNRATQAKRQIGSNIKPFIYAAGLDAGLTAATVINDAPIVFESSDLEDVWRPRNAGAFSGPTRLRSALFQSKNLVSVRLLRQIGITHAVNYLEKFGLERDRLPKDLSLALGSPSFTPLEVATAYAVLANGGYKVEPYLINSIKDSSNNELFLAQPLTVCPNCEPPAEPTRHDETMLEEYGKTESFDSDKHLIRIAPRVIDESIAFIIDDILKDTIRLGTARRALSLERNDIAGKTGTTNGPTDLWFTGYQKHLVTTTWLGMNNNSQLGQYEYGATATLPMWIEFMQQALKSLPQEEREQPNNVVSVLINKETGKLAHPGDKNSMFEYIQSDHLDKLERDQQEGNLYDINLEDIF